MSFCDSLKLEKGMYNIRGKSFTDVLESLDPSENYKETNLNGLDAYQRQLKRFDIKVSGPNCDKVEKFFTSTDSAVLFPEFISRSIKQGMEAFKLIPEITAAKTIIDGIDYRPITATTGTVVSPVTEGASMTAVSVASANSLVSLKKHARVFSSSYEAMRFQNLDVISVIFKKIGMDIAAEQLYDAVTALLPNTSMGVATANTLTYGDLLSLWAAINPYNPNVMIASEATVKKILALTEMKDARAGLGFHGTGELVTPIGAKLIVDTLKIADDKILAFDKDFALQMVQSGDISVEYDKVIDQQLDKAAISVTTGFSTICSDAVKLLDITTAAV